MDEVAASEFTAAPVSPPSTVAPVSAAQPPTLKSPSLPAPAPVEVIAPKPAPAAVPLPSAPPTSTSFQPTPPPQYQPPAAVPVPPATTELPPRSALIEQDPVLQTVIAPDTPAKRATVTNLQPEQVIRDNRSWAELISGSEAQSKPVVQTTSPSRSRPLPAPAPTATSTPSSSTTPRLNRLEQELEMIRAQMRQSLRPTQAAPTYRPEPVPALSANLDLGTSTGRLAPIDWSRPTPSMAALPSTSTFSAWEIASWGTQFTRYDFSPLALSLSFIRTDGLARLDTLVDEVFQFDFLGQIAGEFGFANAAIALQDLKTDTSGLLVDWDVPLAAETMPLTVFDEQGAIALDFSAFDAILYDSPLGVNPLTYGFPAEAEQVAIRPLD